MTHLPLRSARSWLAAALISGFCLSSEAADGRVSVIEAVQLPASPAATWSAIEDFSAWHTWHPAFASTQMLRGDGHSQSSVRVLTTQDGARFTEELVAWDAGARRYRYRIIESPAPVTNYLSTIEIKPAANGSTVVWSSTFDIKQGTSEADAKKLISACTGLDSIILPPS